MSSSFGHFQTEPTIAERRSSPPRVLRTPPLAIISSVAPISESIVNNHEEASDSEAETIVLPERNRRNGAGSRVRGRRRDSPDTDDDDTDEEEAEEEGDGDDSDSDHCIARRSKRPRKRREPEVFSSELSSAPSAPSSPVRGSGNLRSARNGSSTESPEHQHQHHQKQHNSSLSRKRKAPVDSEPQHQNGISRTRQANFPKRATRSSPYSPSPPPISNRTRAIQTSNSPTKTSHKSKQRKVPRPLSSLRDKRSSEELSPSSSRQGSPAGFSRALRPSVARTPGSPVNMVNMPHKPKRDASGRTLLHRAAQRGNLDEVMNIYNQNQDLLNDEDNAGYIPLHEASLLGHADVVQFLLASGSYVDKQSHTDKDTPLMDAVENGHLEVVKILLEKGADPKIRNKSGADALECITEDTPDGTAIEEAIRAALQKRRSKRSSDDENRNSAQVESHSSRDPSVASPVHDTVPPQSRQVAGRRRNARADQTKNEMLWVEGGKNGQQKLREKARLGDYAIVHACLERGVEPDVESLIAAIKGGHDDTVSLLLAFGADADPETSRSTGTGRKNSEETPMLAAIGRNNLRILEYLLDKVDPLRRDSRGRSYMDISKERAGDYWEQEVRMLQAACDKAIRARGGVVSVEKKADKTSPSKKKIEPVENLNTKRARPRRGSVASTSTHRRSESTQSKVEDNNSDDPESKPRREDRRPKEADPIFKKKRRLIQGKDLLTEKNSPSSSKSQPPNSHTDLTTLIKFKSEPKEVDMLEIPEAKPAKRDRSRDRSHEQIILAASSKTTVEKPATKEAVIGKKRNKEIDTTSATKNSRPTTTDPEKKRRRVESDGADNRDEVTVRKVKKGPEVGNGRPKDSAREESRVKRLDSETRSDISSKEDDTKKVTKDQEISRARKPGKEEQKKKRLAQEEKAEKAERKKRKAEEAERKEREQLAQQKEEERIRKESAERERLRSDYLFREQKSIMEKALEESTLNRKEFLDQIERERIAEENRQKELQRIELEKRMEMERQQEEEKRREEEEAEKQRIAEELQKLRLEEEAKAEMEMRQAAERRRQEEEAEARRQQEARRLEQEESEKRRLLEEQCRRAEAQRRESLPVALRLAAENPSVPSSKEVRVYLPLYQAPAQEVNGNLDPNGASVAKANGWILNIQAALILGTTDLSLQEYHFETLDVTEEHRRRMWMLVSPMLCTQRTFQSTNEEIFEDQRVNREKFMQINPLFWLKLDEFNNILKRDQKYAHLRANGLLRTSWVDLTWKAGALPSTPKPSS